MPSIWQKNLTHNSTQIVLQWCCYSKDSRSIRLVYRLHLTQNLIKTLDLDLDPDTVLAEWWWDPRPTGGLRLTDSGFTTLVKLIDLAHWQFTIKDSMLTPRNLLALDRFMTCPYFLQRQRRQHCLILFGNKESMMASLYGDVERFIASLEP